MKALRPPADDTIQRLHVSGSSISPSSSYTCSLTTEAKLIHTPTIFDHGEVYDSPLPIPSSDTHSFWATESITEASSLDKTFQRLTANLDSLYTPPKEERHSRLEPFKTRSLQTTMTKKTIMPRMKGAKLNPDPLSPLSPMHGFNDSKRPLGRPPRRASMIIGLKRMRDTYEDENSAYEDVHLVTPSRPKPKKRVEIIPFLEMGDELPDKRVWQLPTPTSPTFCLPALMETAVKPSLVGFVGTSLPDVPVSPKRKRSTHEDGHLLMRSRSKRPKA
jgi:hypothetical protein